MNYYEPKYLAGVIKNIYPLPLFFRNRYFSDNLTFPTETVTFEHASTSRRIAPFVNQELGSRSVGRKGYQARTYHTPLAAPSRVITNKTLEDKLLGESPYNSGMSPEDRAAEIAARDLEDLQNQIFRLEEYECARLKQDGIIRITGTALNSVVDYNFVNVETAGASDKWTDNYDVLGKLREKAGILRKKGVNPDTIIMGEAAANAFMKNKAIAKLLDLRNVDAGRISPDNLEEGVNYVGRIALPGLIADIYMYSNYYEDESGNLYDMFDPGTVILQSSKEKNTMLFGAVTYIGEDDEYATAMSEYVPYVVVEKDPPVRKLIVASRPLPMPHDIDSWYTIKEVA